MSSSENAPDLSLLYVDCPTETESICSEISYQAATPSGTMNEIDIQASPGNANCSPTLYDDDFAAKDGWDLEPITSKSGSSSGILMDLATNEKHVHADFYNDFEDLFDDDDDLPLSSNN